MKQRLSAEVITCPGRLGDVAYRALQINVEGLNSPFVLTMALPAIGCRALSQQADPGELYEAIAKAINEVAPCIEVDTSGGGASDLEVLRSIGADPR